MSTIIFVSVLACMMLILYTLATSNYENMQIQSDGLFEEKLPPASLGGRQIALSTKIYPPLLTNETLDMQKYIQFGLSETNLANKSVPHVYYYITITKDDKLLLKELFHSHSGNMTLNLHEKNNDTISNDDRNILAAREAVMGAWTSTDNTDNITVLTPIFNEGGLYNFKVEVLGIDNDTNIFKAINSLEFDSRLSVGNVYQYNIDYQSTKNNITIISYYDSIKDFSYSSEGESLTWYMPFDWDIDRLEKDQNILVHNEIQVPRKWFGNVEDGVIGDNASNKGGNAAIDLAIGKVNDKRLGGRSFVVDPYSSQDSVTFHYILDKNYLMNLAQNQSMNFNSSSGKIGGNTNSSEHMKFELEGF